MQEDQEFQSSRHPPPTHTPPCGTVLGEWLSLAHCLVFYEQHRDGELVSLVLKAICHLPGIYEVLSEACSKSEKSQARVSLCHNPALQWGI